VCRVLGLSGCWRDFLRLWLADCGDFLAYLYLNHE
jgi:hypothetical protein